MISFVVPAHDEEALIDHTLACLRAAVEPTGRPYEIVVVEDASRDRTAAIAWAAGARVVYVAHRQISATRNTGARAASGDVLFFVDADTVVEPATLAAALAALDAGAVGGGAMFRFDGEVPLHGRFFERVVSPLFRFARLAAGCFVFCTRTAFEATGGFREDVFACEEVWMSLALRRQGRFVVVPERVITSGRKVRAYSAREMIVLLSAIALRPARLRERRHMGLWYHRRADTAAPVVDRGA